MRSLLCVLLLLFSAAVVCADVSIHNGLVAADVNNQPLRQVVDNLRSQSTINFAVDDGVAATPVSASFHDLSVAEAVKKMLEGTGINYIVVGGANGPESIYIGSSEKPGQPASSRPQPAYRSVVQPVMPQQPIFTPPVQSSYTQPQAQPQQPQQQQQGNLPPGMQRKLDEKGRVSIGGIAPPPPSGTLPPTGGGYAPATGTQTPPPKQEIQKTPPPQPQPAQEDNSDEEDDSEE